ncbi:glycoside hydrolase superfamily [Phellopilus nigrolimitatus]|nr:glycoside hydrolase superfamily [Phellopilus nigrolimitatus]
MAYLNLELKTGWRWKERDTEIYNVLAELNVLDSWNPVRAGMPSEVHVELIKAKEIPHPSKAFMSTKFNREWLYATTLPVDSHADGEFVELVFEGLDTFCSVYVNDVHILEADNQFRTYRVRRVRLDPSVLRKESTVLLHFKCAKAIALEQEKKYGRVRAGSCNLGDPSRVYARKAQYDWRWDWGPELLTVGPYRPIRLLTYTAHIVDLHPQALVSAELTPSLVVEATIRGNTSAVKFMQIVLRTPLGQVKQTRIVASELRLEADLDTELAHWTFEKEEVKLWWPTGYGAQTLYELEVTLFGENSAVLDQQSKPFGFRRVRLIQEPLVEADKYGKGTTFLFEVNNVRMFIGGSNWVPADSFLTTITPDRYRGWLQLMKDGNQNMVRLWGGGVYEPDVFYDLCDELGLLVWQDFQFACGIYPAHDSFVDSVKLEAEDNVRRLRHHPSMALFCGNNEDYQQILQWNIETDLPARKIYEEVLPGIVTALTRDEVPYHRGSPYGGKGWDTADPTVGDVHQWTIWAGTNVYQDYDILGGRFISEFGMPAMPDMRTVNFWLQGAPENERYAQSKIMAQHNKAGSHERRFSYCMGDNFKYTSNLETHVYNTQILQSDAVSYAYRSWRREWRGPGKQFTSGSIVWQINDTWPVTSWAIADYFMRPKPAFYSIARELKPCTVGIFRNVQKSRDCDRPRQFYDFNTFPCVSAEVEVWGTNSALTPCVAKLELSFVDLESNWVHNDTQDVVLMPNQTTEIVKMVVPEPPIPSSGFSAELAQWEPRRTRTHTLVVGARLVDAETGAVLSRTSDWPQPYRYYNFPDPGLKVTVEGEIIGVSVSRPVKGLVFSVCEEENVQWSDNGIDVMPGENQEIRAKGLGLKKLYVAYMGSEQAKEV